MFQQQQVEQALISYIAPIFGFCQTLILLCHFLSVILRKQTTSVDLDSWKKSSDTENMTTTTEATVRERLVGLHTNVQICWSAVILRIKLASNKVTIKCNGSKTK